MESNKTNLDINALVVISGELTGMGEMEGIVTALEPYFNQIHVTAKYTGDSAVNAFPHKEVTGISHFFQLKVTEGSVPVGVCRVCGCTDDHACYDHDYGPCWWVDEDYTLCSHCADESCGDSLAARIKHQNS